MSNQHRVIDLSGSLTIRDAAATLEKLQTALAGASDLTIDCSALGVADLSIIQLLASAKVTAAADGKTLRLVAPPGGALDGLLRQAGLLAADGRPRTAQDSFWTGTPNREAA